jgi:hypothetical protein
MFVSNEDFILLKHYPSGYFVFWTDRFTGDQVERFTDLQDACELAELIHENSPEKRLFIHLPDDM